MESNVSLQRLFDTMPNGLIMVGPEGNIQLVNSQVERQFGYGQEELLGTAIELLIPKRYTHHHRDYRNAFFRSMEQRPMGAGRDLFGLRRDGSEFPVEIALTPIGESGENRNVLCTIVDISERKKAEAFKDELLLELDLRNREITGLYRVSELLRVTGSDENLMTEVAEATRQALSQNSISGVCIHLDGRSYHDPSYVEAPHKQAVSIELQGRRRGSIQTCYSQCPEERAPANADESNAPFLHRVADIIGASVERLEAEAKVIHASKLASIGELAAGIGHEINNPINGIINCAELLLKEATAGSRQEKFLELIRAESERIAVIVASLLAFSRQDKYHYSLASLEDIVGGVLDLCRKRLGKSHILLELSVPGSLPKIMCRSEQLQQVVMNLIINAVHALDERYSGQHEDKKLIITAAEDEVDGEQHIALSIEDRGCGIPPENRERIFDPFFTTKGRDKGTGLGLSVTDGIIKSHGGTIIVESTPGEFTRFTLLLPVGPKKEVPKGES